MENNTQYYVLTDNVKRGPFSIDELSNQNITKDTLIWKHGLEQWTKAQDMQELSTLLSYLPPTPPENMPMPKTWLVESICVTCLCCIPFGIIGIVNATKIESCYQRGNFEQALYHSKQAKKWTLVGFFTAIAIICIYLIILALSLILSK